MDLFIVRHGQSFNNALEDVKDRVEDPPLTEAGEKQAERVGEYLGGGRHLLAVERSDGNRLLDHIYCSPMLRTLQTAQPIGRALNMAPEVWVDIHEWGGIFLDHGDERGIVGYPGMNRSDIEQRFHGYVVPATISEDGWWDPSRGQEQTASAHGRAIGVAEALWERAGEESRIALVAHGGFIDSLLKALLHLLPSQHVGLEHHNTAITHLKFTEAKLQMHYMARTEHLPDELIT
jgi:2,3-bisphosphoglycerate-dependent phosphoglycerate mutase